jgi:hypothetical protein
MREPQPETAREQPRDQLRDQTRAEVRERMGEQERNDAASGVRETTGHDSPTPPEQPPGRGEAERKSPALETEWQIARSVEPRRHRAAWDEQAEALPEVTPDTWPKDTRRVHAGEHSRPAAEGEPQAEDTWGESFERPLRGGLLGELADRPRLIALFLGAVALIALLIGVLVGQMLGGPRARASLRVAPAQTTAAR